MRTVVLLTLSTILSLQAICQQTDSLSIETIMQDPKWIGSSPAQIRWSVDGKYLYFNWNPDRDDADSIYYITPADRIPKKAASALRQSLVSDADVSFNSSRSAYTYAKDGDIYFRLVSGKTSRRITETTDAESQPRFSMMDQKIVYRRGNDLYAWDVITGETMQLTAFKKGVDLTTQSKEPANAQEKWLKEDQLGEFEVLPLRKKKREKAEAAAKGLRSGKKLREIYDLNKRVDGLEISPDGRFISFRLTDTVDKFKNTIIPDYVTESGFTRDISGRTKVGAPEGRSEFFMYDRLKDTVFRITPDSIPGIRDLPDYVKDYPSGDSITKHAPLRQVSFYGPYWNESGSQAFLDIRSEDNKDRWLMALDAVSGRLRLLDRQRDEAWIGGPGISDVQETGTSLWIDSLHFWYQSEASGYSHLYSVDCVSGKKTALTSGGYEVQDVVLSPDKKYFYLRTNEVHPGEQHFYRLPAGGGKLERLTRLPGANLALVSPDQKRIAFLRSYFNKPWELYLQENHPGANPQQITFAAESPAFKLYPWREPELIRFNAADGAGVYARLYKPARAHANKPAVIFVHGAGYLQNAHKWWSSYFREYMFHNFLADHGYTVMDIDYRGSAGYGRDWRTGIYRHMGGKDLSDQIDAASWLVDQQGVNASHIGIYGGSYGGFITLMALFTKPGVFAAGAALRSVTDWAHYNHGYTSAILNEPFNDSLAYKRSSPIYHADGLKDRLLMCHGMVDVNVHFQDIVRLSQRLIELGKNNWELAIYPLEDHAFVEPSSWTDEYKRIFRLFETTLKDK